MFYFCLFFGVFFLHLRIIPKQFCSSSTNVCEWRNIPFVIHEHGGEYIITELWQASRSAIFLSIGLDLVCPTSKLFVSLFFFPSLHPFDWDHAVICFQCYSHSEMGHVPPTAICLCYRTDIGVGHCTLLSLSLSLLHLSPPTRHLVPRWSRRRQRKLLAVQPTFCREICCRAEREKEREKTMNTFCWDLCPVE